MIDMLSTSQVLLRDAGYVVRLATIRDGTLVSFEDNALIGFCATFDSPKGLINGWRAYETEIVTRFAANLRAAGEKAWNVYCVFLTSSPATPDERRQIGWIEENLDRTRKLAASGISNRDDLVRVLLPVLPVQYQPVLLDTDLKERLKKRIGDIAPTARDAVLNEDVPAAEVVNLLGGRG